jgi:hypothetical protein
MKRSLNLSIPTPCSQPWGSFTQVQGGGFCTSCSKVVVDFTTMTDEQIINHFKHATGDTCGRFLPGQLRSYTFGDQVNVRPGWMLIKAGFLSLLFLIIARPATAQVPTTKPKTEIPGSYRMSADSISFRGVVKSAEDHSALPGVNVVLKGAAVGTVTDADGRFEFPQPLNKGDVLVFSFIGLTSKEYQVNGKNDVGFEVPMQLCMDMDITGGVQVEGIYIEKKTGLWSRLKSFFGA